MGTGFFVYLKILGLNKIHTFKKWLVGNLPFFIFECYYLVEIYLIIRICPNLNYRGPIHSFLWCGLSLLTECLSQLCSWVHSAKAERPSLASKSQDPPESCDEHWTLWHAWTLPTGLGTWAALYTPCSSSSCSPDMWSMSSVAMLHGLWCSCCLPCGYVSSCPHLIIMSKDMGAWQHISISLYTCFIFIAFMHNMGTVYFVSQ